MTNIFEKKTSDKIKAEIITKVANIFRICFSKSNTFYEFRLMLLLNGILIVPEIKNGKKEVAYLALEGVSVEYEKHSNIEKNSLNIYYYSPLDLVNVSDPSMLSLLTLNSLTNYLELGNEKLVGDVNRWYEATINNISNYVKLISEYPLNLIPKEPFPSGLIRGVLPINGTYILKREINKYQKIEKNLLKHIAMENVNL